MLSSINLFQHNLTLSVVVAVTSIEHDVETATMFEEE